MKRGWAALAALVVLSAALAGCSSGKKKDAGDTVPEEITEQEIDRLEDLVLEKHPREFSFPGQAALEPVHLVFDDYVSPGTGFGAPEFPNDDGYTDLAGAIVPFDLSESVPVGQPVEIRIKLKWYGDPASSADLDIYVNVPGTHDSYQPSRFDESMNWNIVTKFRVVNTVRIQDAPLEVGFQVSNGKNIHPDGLHYVLDVELRFPKGVLGPGIPYALTVPPGASGLIFDSEPVIGDEHIQSEVVLVAPDNLLAAHFVHNDIVSETRLVPVSGPGQYIVYAPTMHGGFLRVETDVPNPTYNATALVPVWTETALASEVAVSPALPGLSMTGTFDSGASFPLDIVPYIRPSSDPGGIVFQASLNISSLSGWVATAETTGGAQSAEGRAGTSMTTAFDRSNLAIGSYTWVLAGSGVEGVVPSAGSAGLHVDAGYAILTAQR